MIGPVETWSGVVVEEATGEVDEVGEVVGEVADEVDEVVGVADEVPDAGVVTSHCCHRNHFSFAIAHLTSKGAVQPPFFIRVSRLLQTNRFILSLRMSRLLPC